MPRLKILLQSKPFLIFSLIFIGIYVIIFTKVIKYNSLYHDENILSGLVISKKIDGDKLSFIIDAQEKVQVNYYFENETEKEYFIDNFLLGIKVQLQGTLSEPGNNTIPNTFNYREYLYNKKIYRVFNAEEIKIINQEVAIHYKIKNWFLKRIDGFKLTKDYISAFILGDKNGIDSDVYQSFQINGVTHLFAVSGMHIGFLTAFLQGILAKLHLKPKYINTIIILFLIFYMFLIGFSASVIRASLLYVFLLLNKKLNLNLNSLIILYLLFFLLLLINPFYIYDLGFIYSFLTSFGLMIFSKKITGNYFSKLFKVSLIAFLFSLPVTIYNFYEFNLLSILNNIIVVPLVSIVLFPLTLLTFILPILEPLLYFGFRILEYLNLFLSSNSLNVVIPKINIVFFIFFYLIIYLIYKYGYRNISLIILLLVISKFFPYLDNKAYVYYLDVGQGDSTLIIDKHRQNVVLIDTGGKITYSKDAWQIKNNEFSLASNISTFLKSLGIAEVDLLVVTHGDTDHLGYAEEIMEEIKFENIMLNNNTYNQNEKKLLEEPINIVKDVYHSKNFKLQNLNSIVNNDENESSLVLYLTLEEKSFLFMGDAGVEVEEEILSKYNLSNIDILKVGHHGSKTSSSKEFIDEINPKYSIISAGKNNRYGHPNADVLNNLNNSTIYRTDLDGTVMFKIKNNKLEIETCVP